MSIPDSSLASIHILFLATLHGHQHIIWSSYVKMICRLLYNYNTRPWVQRVTAEEDSAGRDTFLSTATIMPPRRKMSTCRHMQDSTNCMQPNDKVILEKHIGRLSLLTTTTALMQGFIRSLLVRVAVFRSNPCQIK